jgi:DNA-binding protein WhiA
MAEDLAGLMARFGIDAQVTERKRLHLVYLKSGERITGLLAVMGAYHAVMRMENEFIRKDLRNQVNRAVNCDTANLGRTVHAAQEQIAAIAQLSEDIGLQRLPTSLRDIAEARLEHPLVSVEELGALMDPPLTKSAAYHRLRRIMAYVRQ